MLKAVFFDAVGTLIHLPRPVGEHYREVAARHGADLDAEALDLAFRRAFKAAPKRAATPGPRPDDDKGWWRNLVAAVLDATMTGKQRVRFDEPAFFEDLYSHFAAPGVWAAYPDAVPALQELGDRGLALAVVSNFDRRLHPVLASLGLSEFFAEIIVSSEVGVEKPDPAIFQHALRVMAVSASEAMHVGDEESDWAAESLGMRVFRLERPETTLRDAADAVRERLQSGAS